MTRKALCTGLLLIGIFLAGCDFPLASPTSTPTPIPTDTPTATATTRPSPTATRTATAAPPAEPGSYEDLVARMKRQDPDLDFTELRMAYAESDLYDPYKYKLVGALNELNDALDAKDYDGAEDALRRAMEINPISYYVNFGGFRLYSELEDENRTEYHRYVLNGVAESIARSGDGASKETAFVVVTIEEEYLLLAWFGLDWNGQALDDSGEHIFDIQSATDPQSGESFDIYFNIDRIFEWLTQNY